MKLRLPATLNNQLKRAFLIFVPFLVLWLLSCSKDSGSADRPTENGIPVTSLDIDFPELVLFPGDSQLLVVSFNPSNTTQNKLTWTSANNAVATVGANGLVMAVSPGTVIITAASLDQPTIKVSTLVTVLRNYDVHVVGNGGFLNYQNCALYWKNGIPKLLEGGQTAGIDAFAVTSSDNDIYIAGTTAGTTLMKIATYWKNGIAVQLSDKQSQHTAYARSISVSGGSVYVAGYTFNSTECPRYCYGRFRGVYWKHTGSSIKEFPLYDNIASTKGFGIAVSGSDVIVAGSRANDNYERWSAYWKNEYSNETPLSSGYAFYQAMAIVTSGPDVFVAGYGGCPDIGCISAAKLWKNNMNSVISLTDGSREAQATGITQANGIVYVCGYEKNAQSKQVARYWKIEGNHVSSYVLTDGTTDARANGIAVSGDDVFVAGYEKNNTGFTVAKYWRVYKGKSWAMELARDGMYWDKDSQANGIFIK